MNAKHWKSPRRTVLECRKTGDPGDMDFGCLAPDFEVTT